MRKKYNKKMIKKLAIESMQSSYSPYSNYKVGACVLGEDNKFYKGTNIENASYGLTICAERTSIFKAISEGNQRIKKIAIATKDGGYPCGACRQVMAEFGNNDLEIIIINITTNKNIYITLGELLPRAFRL